ncbi:translation initiation factor IF-3 [Candidatus Gottesmanbacteria bacterium]|nr:translation initiation factor IF-3 [Candidatus Gottesmanbacteria bacterium]
MFSRAYRHFSKNTQAKHFYRLNFNIQASEVRVLDESGKQIVRYQENKRQREVKRKAKEVTLKQLRLRPFIADHDFLVRVERAKEFLKNGDRLKIVVQFFGREITRKEFGFSVTKKFADAIAEVASQERPPKFEGKTLVSYFSPGKGEKHAKTQNQQSNAETVQTNQNQ